jgi:hypothetical protein
VPESRFGTERCMISNHCLIMRWAGDCIGTFMVLRNGMMEVMKLWSLAAIVLTTTIVLASNCSKSPSLHFCAAGC